MRGRVTEEIQSDFHLVMTLRGGHLASTEVNGLKWFEATDNVGQTVINGRHVVMKGSEQRRENGCCVYCEH